ncbi:MAG TPA: adenylate/guanylate cyclase domain-containing protein, partial [Bryobacteraceae bacterium]|nr:adenylate/guanylate cyclase domain-containing protein [Bryobacteraceae bacterium]
EIAAIVRTLLIIVDLVSQLQQRFGLAAPVRIGAGLNSGPASVGNVGSIAASDYTAVGDVVNKAFRLESATKEVHCDLLMGEETRNLLAGQPDLLRVLNEFSLRLKGYDQATTAWGTDFGKLPPQPPITAAE